MSEHLKSYVRPKGAYKMKHLVRGSSGPASLWPFEWRERCIENPSDLFYERTTLRFDASTPGVRLLGRTGEDRGHGFEFELSRTDLLTLLAEVDGFDLVPQKEPEDD